ncbi:MAG: hypothetical protein GPJ54_06710 [Candidatus Heimdallarchaeota archaeon]|nr:hypothetical protein [Candidatus Heimdallarchaeota archaeon]
MAVEDPTPKLVAIANFDKTGVKFYSYGIFTIPILPLLLLVLHVSLLSTGPQIYILIWLIVVVRLILSSGKEHDPDSSNIVSRALYVLIELTFGVRTSKKNTHQFRLEWFILFGGPAMGFLLFWIYASTILVVPALIIIINRKWFLRTVFKLALLPRSEYFLDDLKGIVDEKSELKMKERREDQEKELQYQSQKEYLHFYPPKAKGRLFSYLFLLLTPIIFVVVFSIFLSLVLDNDVETTITETAGITLVWGYIGILPYLFLSLLRDYRITKFVSTSFSESIISTLTSTSINYLPMFNGDYYFEQNSRVLDMNDTYGIFEIFKNGRWFNIFLLPLAAISFIFTQILRRAEENNPNASLDADRFLGAFSNQILVEQNGTMIFYLLILLPILISIVLPLLWVLKDSELKRTTWEQDEGGGERREIAGVEDLGQTLNRIFGLFLGFSTITGLSGITRDLVDKDASTADIYIIVIIMIILGGLLVLPGVLFMSYRYFSLGDHAAGVNYLRYNLSQSEYIGVGTIVKGYDVLLDLPKPLSAIIKKQVDKKLDP